MTMKKSVCLALTSVVCAFAGGTSRAGNDWYVNANVGDDGYDGTAQLPAPDATTSKVGPKKTLKAAMEIPGLAADDIVHAAAGTYAEGEMGPDGYLYSTTTNRVIVKSGVGLVADEGPDVTFIEGRKPSTGKAVGPDAIRCVALQEYAWIKDFTLKGGATMSNGSSSDCGGGVYSCYNDTCAVGCRFIGNSAVRGGAANGGCYVNCYFSGNVASSGTASSLYSCYGAFGCVFDRNDSYGNYTKGVNNCTFLGCAPCGATLKNGQVRNSYIGADCGSCDLHNCLVSGANYKDTCTFDDATRFGVTGVEFDEGTFRPKFGKSDSLINKGVNAHYSDYLPERWAAFGTVDSTGTDRFFGGTIDIGANEYVYHDWYVDAEKGCDDSDGKDPAHAKKTLKAVMEIASLAAGDVVHALPGVYRDGIMDPVEGGSTSNRVVVKDGVGLVADAGPEVTVIEGFRTSDAKGAGAAAVRCCYLAGADSYIRGFTLRNGAAYKTGNTQECGGGVAGADGAAAIDCIITNNVASRGSGSHLVTCIRCVFDNSPSTGSADCGAYYGSYFDCLFGSDAVYTSYEVCNCTLLRGYLGSPSGTAARRIAWNTIAASDGGQRIYRNCVLGGGLASNSSKDDDTKLDRLADFEFDGEGRPANADSIFVDAGTNDYYDAQFPAKWVRFKNVPDGLGGQRVYNANRIDIGAREFDWRRVYEKKLAAKRLTVVEATPGTADAAGGVLLSDGDGVEIDWTITGEGKSSFHAVQDGAGVLTVTLDGEPLAGEDGVFAFEVEPGVHRVVLSFAGEGHVTASDFVGVRKGFQLLVR